MLLSKGNPKGSCILLKPHYAAVLRDFTYHRKPTPVLALRDETENACRNLNILIKATQAAVHYPNKRLEANGHRYEHLL